MFGLLSHSRKLSIRMGAKFEGERRGKQDDVNHGLSEARGLSLFLVIRMQIDRDDLSKTTFRLVALGIGCQVVVRKKFPRQQLLL
jgi:hypothetical protein